MAHRNPPLGGRGFPNPIERGGPPPPPPMPAWTSTSTATSSSTRPIAAPPILKYSPPASDTDYSNNLDDGIHELERLSAYCVAHPDGENMNFTGRALQNWSLPQATDEFVQNWHDQVEYF